MLHINSREEEVLDSAAGKKDLLKRVAIVGDGLASAICIDQLVNVHGLHHIQIDVYSSGSGIGRGKAYSQSTPESMTLNHKVKSMYFSDEDGGNFLRYLQENYASDVTRYDYVPRKVFGDFVEKSMAETFNRSANIELVPQNVTNLSIEKDKIILSAGNLARAYSDVVFCVGGGTDKNKLAAYDNRDTGNKNIAIVGASLSAIDKVMHLFSDRQSYPEKVTLLQRNAGFRMVRPFRDGVVKPNILTPELVRSMEGISCDHLVSLLQAEIESHGVKYDLLTYGGLTHAPNFSQSLAATLLRLERDPYNLSDQAEFKVYAVMKAIIPQIMDIFENGLILPEEAEKFRNKAEKPIMCFLAPMPPFVAGALGRLIEQGRLEINNGFDMRRDADDLQAYDDYFDVRGVNNIPVKKQDVPSFLHESLREGIIDFSKWGGLAYDQKKSTLIDQTIHGLNMPYLIGQLKKGQQFDNSESYVIYMDCKKVSQSIAAKYYKEKRMHI